MHRLFSGKFTTLGFLNVAVFLTALVVFLNALVMTDVGGRNIRPAMLERSCSQHARLVCKLLCVALESLSIPGPVLTNIAVCWVG
jgi:hypothetical protein